MRLFSAQFLTAPAFAVALAGAATMGNPPGLAAAVGTAQFVPLIETGADTARAQLIRPADAETTSSGLATKVSAAGVGSTHPNLGDTVTVRVSAWRTNGQQFMNATQTTVPLIRTSHGFREGVYMMVVGEKRRMWVPRSLAGVNLPSADVVVDVELLGISQ